MAKIERNIVEHVENGDTEHIVTVEQEIGRITIGPGGLRHPFDAAMEIIITHQHRSEFPDAVYHFPGSDGRATVEFTQERNDA